VTDGDRVRWRVGAGEGTYAARRGLCGCVNPKANVGFIQFMPVKFWLGMFECAQVKRPPVFALAWTKVKIAPESSASSFFEGLDRSEQISTNSTAQ
jgi:hypothetical protein